MSRSVPLLSSSLLESLLEDSLTTMLMLDRSETVEDETFVLHKECNKLTADSATLSMDSSWQSDQSYDLNKIPVVSNFLSFRTFFSLNFSNLMTEETHKPLNYLSIMLALSRVED